MAPWRYNKSPRGELPPPISTLSQSYPFRSLTCLALRGLFTSVGHSCHVSAHNVVKQPGERIPHKQREATRDQLDREKDHGEGCLVHRSKDVEDIID